MWMHYSLSSAGAEQSSPKLEDLGLPKAPPSMLDREVRNRFHSWAFGPLVKDVLCSFLSK